VRRARLSTDGPVDRRRLDKALSAQGLAFGAPAVVYSTVLDTVDRRLAAAGLALEVLPDGAVLWSDDGARVGASRNFELGAEGWTSSRGLLRDRLREVVGLQPLLTTHGLVRRTRVALDEAGAEALRLVEVGTDRPGIPDPVHTEAVVTAPGAEVERALRRALLDLGLSTGGKGAMVAAERALGVWSGGKSKGVLLDPAAPASITARRVMAPLYDRMIGHETGVLADQDIEHLHDWRVALRSARATLSLLQGALPRAEGRELRGRLRELQAETGALRDLDVTIPVFERWLTSTTDEEGALALRAWLAAQREEALAHVCDVLRANRYRKTMKRWNNLISGEGLSGGEGGLPTAPLIRLKVHQAWSLVVAEGSAITGLSEDEALHELRKSGKRLRYLLELFGSTLPAGPVKAAIKLLKHLQDTLGHFQDEAVRAEWLVQAVRAIGPSGAIDALQARVANEHVATRLSFEAVFHRFVSEGASLCAEITGTTRPGRG